MKRIAMVLILTLFVAGAIMGQSDFAWNDWSWESIFRYSGLSLGISTMYMPVKVNASWSYDEWDKESEKRIVKEISRNDIALNPFKFGVNFGGTISTIFEFAGEFYFASPNGFLQDDRPHFSRGGISNDLYVENITPTMILGIAFRYPLLMSTAFSIMPTIGINWDFLASYGDKAEYYDAKWWPKAGLTLYFADYFYLQAMYCWHIGKVIYDNGIYLPESSYTHFTGDYGTMQGVTLRFGLVIISGRGGNDCLLGYEYDERGLCVSSY
jgi:hypothetical protein